MIQMAYDDCPTCGTKMTGFTTLFCPNEDAHIQKQDVYLTRWKKAWSSCPEYECLDELVKRLDSPLVRRLLRPYEKKRNTPETRAKIIETLTEAQTRPPVSLSLLRSTFGTNLDKLGLDMFGMNRHNGKYGPESDAFYRGRLYQAGSYWGLW